MKKRCQLPVKNKDAIHEPKHGCLYELAVVIVVPHERPREDTQEQTNTCFPTMSMNATETETPPVEAPKKTKKLKPARKQVKPGDVVKTETPQTGKEYSAYQYF